jgi:hypothetical protein
MHVEVSSAERSVGIGERVPGGSTMRVAGARSEYLTLPDALREAGLAYSPINPYIRGNE